MISVLPALSAPLRRRRLLQGIAQSPGHRPRALLHAWGNADCGQLGVELLPSDEESDTHGHAVLFPRAVPLPPSRPGSPVETVTHVSCGAAHTAVVLTDGTLLTCGLGDRGQLGVRAPLGDGTQGAPGNVLPPIYKSAFALARVHALPAPIRVAAAGGAHTLAVAQDGLLYSFGCNARGQLGREQGTTPAASPGGILSRLALGRSHTLDPAPGLVTALADAGERVVDAAAGADFSVALGESGNIYTWGAADAGKLAHGHGRSRDDYHAGPTASSWLPRLLERGSLSDEPRPRLVKALEGEPGAAVFAGSHCAGAILRSGRFVVWGSGRGYMLGNGHEKDVWEPEPALEYVNTGGAGSSGTAATSNSSTPRRYAPQGKIAFGLSHSVFLTGSGGVYTVGAGDHGCLGIGTLETAVSAVPVGLPEAGPATDVAAGWCFTLAAQPSGSVLAWGSGAAGALGPGAKGVDRWYPQPVESLDAASPGRPCRVAVPSSGRHALAW